VFGELNSDQARLDRLLVDGASLTGALAEKGSDLELVIANLDEMMGAIGRQEANLASAIGQLPDFMRQFNTTAVNLRAALDDVDPLIDASRPVARKLKPFMRRLRGFTADAVPTLKRLDGIVRRPGGANDLIELTELQVPLAEIGVGPVTRNGRSREGALPASTQALTGGLDQLEFFRPYITTEAISGWFDDFSHSGFPDAIGGIGRISTTLNPLTALSPATPLIPPGVFDQDVIQGLLEGAGLDTFNSQRCPGSNVNFKDGGSQPTAQEISRLQYQDDPSYDDEPGGQLDCAGQDQTLPGSP
jgi:phospholipid/cholesterol/gamma-HCH transport system substrate-binding protein